MGYSISIHCTSLGMRDQVHAFLQANLDKVFSGVEFPRTDLSYDRDPLAVGFDVQGTDECHWGILAAMALKQGQRKLYYDGEPVELRVCRPDALCADHRQGWKYCDHRGFIPYGLTTASDIKGNPPLPKTLSSLDEMLRSRIHKLSRLWESQYPDKLTPH